VSRLVSDPLKGLKAKEAADRQLTAMVLIGRYRARNGPVREVLIPAEESRLILKELAEADWSGRDAKLKPYIPMNSFFMLNLTETDGWKHPGDGNKVPEAAKQWLREHAATYRIKRMVPATKSE